MPDLILHTTCLMSCSPPLMHPFVRVSLNVDTFGVFFVMVEQFQSGCPASVPTEWCPLSVDAQFPEMADAIRHMADVIERLASEGGA